MQENADLNLEAAELCSSCEKSAMQFTPAIQPLISDWSPTPSKERSWIDDTPQREDVC